MSVLYAANWSPSRASGPSKRICPWWMTIDALAERLDVGHVVARQQDGRLVAAVVLGDERRGSASASSRRARSSARRGRAPAAGAAASRRSRPSSARRARGCRTGLRTRSPTSSSSISSSRSVRELGTRDPVDRPVQLERVERGQVPLELVAVAHHERDPAEEVALALRGHVAEHARLAGGRVEEPGEHLQRRRLAGAVRAEEADDLSRPISNEIVVDRADLAVLAADEALDGTRGAPPPARGRGTSCSARRRGRRVRPRPRT